MRRSNLDKKLKFPDFKGKLYKKIDCVLYIFMIRYYGIKIKQYKKVNFKLGSFHKLRKHVFGQTASSLLNTNDPVFLQPIF